MDRVWGIDWFCSKLSGLRDVGLAAVKASERTLLFGELEFNLRAILGSAYVCWVV